jgi:glutathione synthase/RimK-type ligase-like ATP-grasp enzyme
VTTLINPKSLIYWNIDKHYLQDLEKLGVRIPPTLFIEQKDNRSLEEIIASSTWEEFILKPAISGAARHTYKISRDEITNYESQFSELIANESMLIQEYQKQITTKGEIAFMVFGGKFSHAILKKAKSGDFRVQDDFGGTIETYIPNNAEIQFAESVIGKIQPVPVYARVDAIWDNTDQLCIGEVELIEPELWFRMDSNSADKCAKAIVDFLA